MCRRLELGCAVNRTGLTAAPRCAQRLGDGRCRRWRLRSHSVSCVALLGCDYCSLRLVWRVPELLDLLQSVPECTNASTCQCAADRTRYIRFAASGGSAPGGPWYFTVLTVEKRATVVAVDVYGCFMLLIIYCCSTGRTSTQRSSVGAWGKREWKDVESSRVVDGIHVMSSECGDGARNTIIPASSILRPASSVQRPDPPSLR